MTRKKIISNHLLHKAKKSKVITLIDAETMLKELGFMMVLSSNEYPQANHFTHCVYVHPSGMSISMCLEYPKEGKSFQKAPFHMSSYEAFFNAKVSHLSRNRAGNALSPRRHFYNHNDAAENHLSNAIYGQEKHSDHRVISLRIGCNHVQFYDKNENTLSPQKESICHFEELLRSIIGGFNALSTKVSTPIPWKSTDFSACKYRVVEAAHTIFKTPERPKFHEALKLFHPKPEAAMKDFIDHVCDLHASENENRDSFHNDFHLRNSIDFFYEFFEWCRSNHPNPSGPFLSSTTKKIMAGWLLAAKDLKDMDPSEISIDSCHRFLDAHPTVMQTLEGYSWWHCLAGDAIWEEAFFEGKSSRSYEALKTLLSAFQERVGKESFHQLFNDEQAHGVSFFQHHMMTKSRISKGYWGSFFSPFSTDLLNAIQSVDPKVQYKIRSNCANEHDHFARNVLLGLGSEHYQEFIQSIMKFTKESLDDEFMDTLPKAHPSLWGKHVHRWVQQIQKSYDHPDPSKLAAFWERHLLRAGRLIHKFNRLYSAFHPSSKVVNWGEILDRMKKIHRYKPEVEALKAEAQKSRQEAEVHISQPTTKLRKSRMT